MPLGDKKMEQNTQCFWVTGCHPLLSPTINPLIFKNNVKNIVKSTFFYTFFQKTIDILYVFSYNTYTKIMGYNMRS